MKIEVTENKAQRKLMGYLTSEGILYLRLKDGGDQKNCVIINITEGAVSINGRGTISLMFDPAKHTPIYEGDSLTITF